VLGAQREPVEALDRRVAVYIFIEFAIRSGETEYEASI
jgi:hypothetical protein